MDDEYSTWYILFVIVTIISFILTILFSLLFIYFPSQRAGGKFNDLSQRGSNFYNSAQETADDILLTADVLTDFSVALCQGIEDSNGLLLTQIKNSGELDEFCESFNDG